METNIHQFKAGDNIRCVGLVESWGDGEVPYNVGDVFIKVGKGENLSRIDGSDFLWRGDNGIWELVEEEKKEPNGFAEVYMKGGAKIGRIPVFVSQAVYLEDGTEIKLEY